MVRFTVEFLCLTFILYRICRNKRPRHSISKSKKKIFKLHRFHVLPPLKNHPSKPIGFMYSPLWKMTHQSPLVSCTPPFEKSLFGGRLFQVGASFRKYGLLFMPIFRLWCNIIRVFFNYRGEVVAEADETEQIIAAEIGRLVYFHVQMPHVDKFYSKYITENMKS